MIGLRRYLALGGPLILVVLSTIWSRGLLAASALQQLTTDPATDVRPVWSPDGQHIAFQSNRSGSYSIWIMDAGGKNQREVTPGDSDDRHAAWRPDGKQLAFDSETSGAREIWIIDNDGQNRRQLTSLGAVSNFPAWSPDGSQIAFYVYQNGAMNLWAVQVDGSDPRPLIADLANERNNQCTFACHQIAWSPDGQKIAYTGGDHRSIWLADADGSNPTEIVPGKEYNQFPWYTHDGRIGYLTMYVSPTESWTNAWVLDPVNGQSALLLDRIQLQGPLEWSPDGTKVLFHSPRGGNFDIYAVNLQAEGGQEVLQTSPGAVASSPEPDAGATTPAPETELVASAPTTQAGVEAQPSPVEVTNSAWFASPLLLGAIGLAGLIGLIAVGLAVRRKRLV